MKTNDTNYESLKDKIKNLQALADRGYNGEAENARRLIEKLCNQYGVTLEQVLCENEVKQYDFEFGRNKVFLTLFCHCHAKITGKSQMKYWNKTRSIISVELTALQFADLKGLYEWHKANFKHDIEILKQNILEAYLNKHDLFSEESSNEDPEPLTEERLEHIWQILNLTKSLNDSSYLKMIE